jgi:hypothetical protein
MDSTTGAGFGTRVMLEEAKVLNLDPRSAEMKAFTQRLGRYGASQEFCSRIYANGIAADLDAGRAFTRTLVPFAAPLSFRLSLLLLRRSSHAAMLAHTHTLVALNTSKPLELSRH